MTFKTLLAHVEPAWGSGEAIDVCLQLARRFQAHVVGVAGEAFELPNAFVVDGELIQAMRDEIDVDQAAARTRFALAAAQAPAGATFRTGVARPADLIAAHARGADLVVARRTPSGAGGSNLCRPEDLVMGCGAPVLLAPHAPAALEARRIVIAWKDSREARRAVADALPFLTAAEQVAVVAVRSQAEVAEAQDEVAEVVERLRRLGVPAEAQVRPSGGGSPLRQIEEAANQLGADLLVAGAYGHSRLREWAFGGVTQDLLADCDRYVLFSR